jgi:hypothetical protein
MHIEGKGGHLRKTEGNVMSITWKVKQNMSKKMWKAKENLRGALN